jgi:hypothetical protein
MMQASSGTSQMTPMTLHWTAPAERNASAISAPFPWSDVVERHQQRAEKKCQPKVFDV